MTKQAFLKHGLIHYYYGKGRGKTSTSIGTIIRAIGHGLKPILIQFLKLHDPEGKHSGYFIGEIEFLRKYIPIKQFGSYEFIYPKKESLKKHILRAKDGLAFAKDSINSKEYDLVVLDEIGVAISLKLIDLHELLAILKNKPKPVEIICTGAPVIKKLKDLADYCTEYNYINHPYHHGYDARPGIEY
jgi:cob(I)alamin adenosyltransferase